MRENKSQINEKTETKLFEMLTNISFIWKQLNHILPNATPHTNTAAPIVRPSHTF